MILLHNIL